MKRRQWSRELLKQKRIEDEKKIKQYRSLVDTVLNLKETQIYTKDSLKLSKEVLQWNPEFNTVWNFRRDIIENVKGQLDVTFWEDELNFTMAELKKFPKVYWIWNHRVWVLKNHIDSSLKIWQRELIIVNKLLDMDARNFHGWHYRRRIIKVIEDRTGKSNDHEELELTTQKINKNISNFSAWHQRVQLITRMNDTDEFENRKEFITNEIDYITNAMFTDAEDQSVWFYMEWFLEYEMVSKVLNHNEYTTILNKFQSNILIINEDDKEFSGKENPWCLKMLIIIEKLQTNLGIEIKDGKSKEWIAKLIEADPLRKNRYLYLLHEEK